jgi:hypothetical protein
VKLFVKSSVAAALALLITPSTAFATHLSGGENDLMGVYAAIALVLGFAGLLALLGLVPRGWRSLAQRYGRWLLAAGVLVLLGGGYHVATIGTVEEALGDLAFGRLATQQLIGTLVVFVGFWGGVYYLGKKSGVLNMGESVKYALFRNGDPPDRTASRKDRPGEQRLMWIPFAAMGAIALSLTAGVLYALYRLPPGSRP